METKSEAGYRKACAPLQAKPKHAKPSEQGASRRTEACFSGAELAALASSAGQGGALRRATAYLSRLGGS